MVYERFVAPSGLILVPSVTSFGHRIAPAQPDVRIPVGHLDPGFTLESPPTWRIAAAANSKAFYLLEDLALVDGHYSELTVAVSDFHALNPFALAKSGLEKTCCQQPFAQAGVVGNAR